MLNCPSMASVSSPHSSPLPLCNRSVEGWQTKLIAPRLPPPNGESEKALPRQAASDQRGNSEELRWNYQ